MAIACAWKNARAGGRFPSAFQCNARGFLEKSAIFSDRRPGRVKFATSDDVPMEARRNMNMSWPFARTRRESKAAVPLVALSQPQLGAPAWGRRDAAALTQDGYLRNAVAYRCVRMVADVDALAQLRGLAPGPLAQPVPECRACRERQALLVRWWRHGQTHGPARWVCWRASRQVRYASGPCWRSLP